MYVDARLVPARRAILLLALLSSAGRPDARAQHAVRGSAHGIPGVATVTLNEQVTAGDDIRSASLTVNAVHRPPSNS